MSPYGRFRPVSAARVRGAAYDAFIKTYLETASSLFPGALLHFEDFGPDNARRILVTYGDRYRIFNDDMQGTGAITLAGVLAAVKVTGVPMAEQKLLVFGAGTAGVGIADQLRDAMIRDGASADQARSQVWLVDKQGLLTSDMTDLRDFQKPYARDPGEVTGWATGGAISLLDTVRHVAPTVRSAPRRRTGRSPGRSSRRCAPAPSGQSSSRSPTRPHASRPYRRMWQTGSGAALTGRATDENRQRHPVAGLGPALRFQ